MPSGAILSTPLSVARDQRRLDVETRGDRRRDSFPIFDRLDALRRACQCADERRQRRRIIIRPGFACRQHLLRQPQHDVGAEMQDAADTGFHCHRIPRRADTEAIDMTAGQAFPPCKVAAIRRAARLRPDRCRRPPSRSGAGSCGWRTGTSCRRSRARRLWPCAPRPAGASARDDTIGSDRSPSASAVSSACKAGDTVMALPLSARLNGTMNGTRTWPMPRLDAIGSGANIWAASNKPMLSLSRTFDHDTSRTSSTARPSAAAKP